MACLKGLVGKGIIKEPGLWYDVFDIKLFAEQSFLWYIGIGIEGFETVVFQFHIQFVTYYVITAWIGKIEFGLENLTDGFMFAIGAVYRLCHVLAFFCAFFQLACQLYTDFIGFSVSINNHIDHIYHLVEDFFHHRIAKAVTR